MPIIKHFQSGAVIDTNELLKALQAQAESNASHVLVSVKDLRLMLTYIDDAEKVLLKVAEFYELANELESAIGVAKWRVGK